MCGVLIVWLTARAAVLCWHPLTAEATRKLSNSLCPVGADLPAKREQTDKGLQVRHSNKYTEQVASVTCKAIHACTNPAAACMQAIGAGGASATATVLLTGHKR